MSNTEYHVLRDVSSTGHVNNWNSKKQSTERVAYSMGKAGLSSRAANIQNCGTNLIFAEKVDGGLKLYQANFCKDRMCPLCTWRRSLKLFGQTSKLMNYVSSVGSFRFVFLTLTLKNCSGDNLRSSVSELIHGFSLLLKRQRLKGVVLGVARHIEVTFNHNQYSKSFKTFHPHIHAVLMVKPSYFGDSYIKQAEWQSLWQSCCSLDYEPVIHIETINKSEQNNAVAELCKYPVKFDGLLHIGNLSLFDYAIDILAHSLVGIRLIEYYGLFRRYRAVLKLEDVDNGDLVNTENDELRADLTGVIYKYQWRNGFYYMVDDFTT